MKRFLKIFIIEIFFIFTFWSFRIVRSERSCAERKAVVCYWASWSVYRKENGHHNIEHIMPELCTHIVYTFAGLDIEGKITSLNPEFDIEQGGFKKLIALKERDVSGCLKIILAIGGWDEGSEKYSLMAESAANREKFADSVLRFLVFYGFDGIDIDWEYPTQNKGLLIDRDNFTELLRVLKKKLAPRNRILSAAVTGELGISKTAYDVRKICQELDYVSIMGYDFQRNNATSIHSPLKAEPNETFPTISDTIEYYKKNGCPAEKIILGMPAYGRSFTLKDARVAKLGAPVAGLGKLGEYTRAKGLLGYNEICEMQKKQSGWKRKYMEQNAAVYAYNGKLWVSYDDERTAIKKAEYVLKENLGGIMLWSIDTDDFQGICTNQRYPLLNAINKGLQWNDH